VFSVLAACWPSQESDRTEIWSVRSSDRVAHNVQRLMSIAPEVIKRAVLPDDDRTTRDRIGSPGEPKSEHLVRGMLWCQEKCILGRIRRFSIQNVLWKAAMQYPLRNKS
jgi:hypothetical protein